MNPEKNSTPAVGPKKILVNELHFFQMYYFLRKIAKDYMTPEQIRRSAEKRKDFSLGYEEELEMAYENIQNEAQKGLKGVRLPKKKIQTDGQQ